MKQYEITYLTKEENTPAGKAVQKEIESLGGKIINASSLGQKSLAYKIKKEKQAYFTTVTFELEGEKITELNRKLALKDEILRYLITSFKKPKEIPPKVLKKEEKAAVSPKPISPKPEEKEIKIPQKVQLPTMKLKHKKKVEEIEMGEEERLKALDEKLEELLKE